MGIEWMWVLVMRHQAGEAMLVMLDFVSGRPYPRSRTSFGDFPVTWASGGGRYVRRWACGWNLLAEIERVWFDVLPRHLTPAT